jgi:hypothetical protein
MAVERNTERVEGGTFWRIGGVASRPCPRDVSGRASGHVGAGTPAFFERAVQISLPDKFLIAGPDFGNIRPTSWGRRAPSLVPINPEFINWLFDDERPVFQRAHDRHR